MPPEFKQPEYVHVLLNHLPIYGLGVSAAALLIGLVFRSRAVQLTACLLVALTAGFYWPVAESGEEAYDRVYAMSNTDAQQWLDLHAERGEQWGWLFYVTSVAAVAALILGWGQIPHAFWAVCLVLGLAVWTVGTAIWIAYPGGKVRHSEFRDGPPPQADRIRHHEEHNHPD
jgi:hypothetical protein